KSVDSKTTPSIASATSTAASTVATPNPASGVPSLLASILSHRSHAYAAIKDYDSALADGMRMIDEVAPNWLFSFARAGAALAALKRWKEAADVFERGVKVASKLEDSK